MPSLISLGFVRNRRPREIPVEGPDMLAADNNRRDAIPADIGQQITIPDINQVIPNRSLDYSKLTIDTIQVNQYIQGGMTAYNTGVGFWLGNDPTDRIYKFSIGDPAGNELTWDGTTLAVRGAISASSIDIPNTTTVLSFHVNTVGTTWIGTTNALFTASNENAQVYFLNTGAGFIRNTLQVGVSSGNFITIDGANQRIRSSTYVSGVSGFNIDPTLIEAQNILARGTMSGSVFRYDVISAVGGQMIVANSDTLSTAMTALDASTLTIRGNVTFAVNDMLIIRAQTASGIQEEWLRVTAIGAAPTYTVTRDLAGTYPADANPAWPAGTPVTKQGVSNGGAVFSGGWLRMLGEGTNSPHYSVFVRTGVLYNAYAERCRLGNLNGIGGQVIDTFGLFLGNFSTSRYLMYDDVSGNLTINGLVNGLFGFGGSGADGALNVAAGTTTLNLDQIYNFTTITVAAGATLTFTGTTGGLAILNATGNVAIAGTIELRNIINTLKTSATRRDNTTSGTGQYTYTANVGGAGGARGVPGGVAGDGGNGGDSNVAGTGAGGAAGGIGASGANGSGGNSTGGGGGGGGGGASDAVIGVTAGTAGAGNDGGNGGIGGQPAFCGGNTSGGGGGGGGGWNTGNGGNGGAGGDAGCGSGGSGGRGGASGANGGNGGNGGRGGTSGAGGVGFASPAAGAGGAGYTNGGNGGAGGTALTGAFSGATGGTGGVGVHGTGGTGGTGGASGSGAGGTGGTGGNGRTGGTGGTGGAGAGALAPGNGGAGGTGAAGSAALVLYAAGTMNLAGMTLNAQGGNGGNGGAGGVGGTGNSNGGNGGNGGGAADIFMLSIGALSGAYTINNTGGTGGSGGAGQGTGVAGAVGSNGRNGLQIVAQIFNT